MLKYIEVLRAIEHVKNDPFLSNEEGVVILRNLRHELPGDGFEGPFKPTVDILRKKIVEAIDARTEKKAEAHPSLLVTREERVTEPDAVVQPRPAALSKSARGSKEKPRKA